MRLRENSTEWLGDDLTETVQLGDKEYYLRTIRYLANLARGAQETGASGVVSYISKTAKTSKYLESLAQDGYLENYPENRSWKPGQKFMDNIRFLP